MKYAEILEETILSEEEFNNISHTSTIKTLEEELRGWWVYLKPLNCCYPIAPKSWMTCAYFGEDGCEIESDYSHADDDTGAIIPVLVVGETNMKNGDDIAIFDSTWEYQNNFLIPINEPRPLITSCSITNDSSTITSWEKSVAYKRIKEYFNMKYQQANEQEKD